MKLETLKTDGFYYLASPYSDPNWLIRQERVDALRRAQAVLMRAGLFVYPAVGATHEVALSNELPYEFEYWHELNFTFLNSSEGMIIVPLLGWGNSRGLAHEIGLCREMGKPIFMLNQIAWTVESYA